MPVWHVREFHEDDLDRAIQLWDDPAAGGNRPLFGVGELVSAIRERQPAVVATVGEDLVGAVVASAHRQHAWILRLSLQPSWRGRGIGSAMLTELERRLLAAGAHRITAVLGGDTEFGAAAMRNSGYHEHANAVFYEKREAVGSVDRRILQLLGGQLLRPDAWDRLGGMAREKELIERRVILPLAHPDLAARTGLVPPRAIVLFGPPGTGKTTFAKGIAARLGWPFVELFPSRLAGDTPAGLAAALAEAFGLVAELENLILFIDEVEEIAGTRNGAAPTSVPGVTNEMLKLIPMFRERDSRLLVCATNSIRALDAALLRHGRFDYVIPVGPPDTAARAAVWRQYVDATPHAPVDMAAIVDASDLFTPADIEFASRKAAQQVFERALGSSKEPLAATDDFLSAINATRRTLSTEMVEQFREDISRYARV